MRAAQVLLAAAIFGLAAALPSIVGAQDTAEPVRLLDVPYLPQTEALCGGAAAAMVMRYWGATGVHAESFADLVDPAEGGIRGDDLLQALRVRGWQARSFRGDTALVQTHLASRRPVIALIEDRPGRFHYVVLVAWTRGRVVVHDPARAPYRVYAETTFHTAWARSGFWTLLALPDGPEAVDEGVAPAALPDSAPANGCGSMLDEGVRLAGAGRVDEARRLLELAAETCPGEPGPWRELAGLHALRQEWRAAAAVAREALARKADDAHAGRILATSLFLDRDPDAALEAWNRLGEPIVDLIDVTGLERMRYDVIARAVGLEPQRVLTAPDLSTARRRLSEIPGAVASRVFYTPAAGGRANVNVAVVERPLVPRGPMPLTAAAVRSLTDREVSLSVANPTGSGEVIAGFWRWWEHRPRVALAFSTPAVSTRLGTIWRVDVFGERQTYAAQGELEERRRGAAFTIADWASPSLRWEASVGGDRWPEHGGALSIGGSIERRAAADRFAIRARGWMWTGGVNTAAAALQADWRSRIRPEGHVWLARAGLDAAETAAPLALWSGAGTGYGRDVLLRGHALLERGVIRNGVFGRTLTHGGIEWRRWTQPRTGPVRIAPAVFVDVARAARGLYGFDGRLHLDAGAGLRVALPASGVLRVDLGRGLRDGEMALSVGWTR